jgi:arylsulfatase A-like enzyme
MYPLDEIELPPIKTNDLGDIPDYGQRLVNLGWDAKVKDNGLVKEAIRGYLASVTFSDAHMGRVLKALDESPHRDNTIVILISDHGFHLGEKQNWTKGTLWEEATDSVMMWRVPGLTRPNQICTRPVSLLDIYPTLVDLNGIERPDHLDGHSLLPLLKDVTAQHHQPAITVYDGHMSVRTKTARFIRYWDGTTEIYDRTKDPHEWTNQTNNPQFAAMKTKLAGLLPPKEEVVEPLPSRQAGAVNSMPRKPKPIKRGREGGKQSRDKRSILKRGE